MTGFLVFVAVCLFMALVVDVLYEGKQKTPPRNGGTRLEDFSPEEDRFR